MTGITQLERDVSVDLRFGQPDPVLLPSPLVARHVDATLAAYGPAALAYGANAGPLPARAALASWSRVTEGGSWGPENAFVTAGASHALTLLCRELGRDGDCVLVQRASYNLALDLFRYHGLQPCPVGVDPCVPTAEELTEAADAVRRAGKGIAFAYFVPTFHNPTGCSWTPAERAEILRACQRLDATIVEDDPYRELFFAAPSPHSLAAMSGRGGVIGVRTLSKVLAPGVRVGWVLAERSFIVRLEKIPHQHRRTGASSARLVWLGAGPPGRGGLSAAQPACHVRGPAPRPVLAGARAGACSSPLPTAAPSSARRPTVRPGTPGSGQRPGEQQPDRAVYLAWLSPSSFPVTPEVSLP